LTFYTGGIRQRATFGSYLRQVPTFLPPSIYAACAARRGERLGPVSAPACRT